MGAAWAWHAMCESAYNRQTSMPPGGIRTHDLSRRAAADLRLRPRGHWDRHLVMLVMLKYKTFVMRNKVIGLYYIVSKE